MARKKRKKATAEAGSGRDRSSGARPSRAALYGASIVFILALAARIVYLIEIRDNPFFDNPLVDCEAYLDKARSIAAGDWIGGPHTYWQAPLYPYVLALLLGAFSENLFVEFVSY